MKVIIALFTYRRPALLKRAIYSVCQQDYKNWELHVFDNHSQDNTKQTVLDIQSAGYPIVYHCRPVNLGGLLNFACSFKEIQGADYFSLLADDDFYMPNFLSTTLAAHAKYPEVGMVIGNSYSITATGHINRSVLPANYFAAEKGVAALIQTMPFIYGTLFHKKIFSRIPSFPTNVFFLLDLHFLYLCATYYPIVILKEHLSCAQAWHNSETYRSRKNHGTVARELGFVHQDLASRFSESEWPLVHQRLRNWLLLYLRTFSNSKPSSQEYRQIFNSIHPSFIGWATYLRSYINWKLGRYRKLFKFPNLPENRMWNREEVSPEEYSAVWNIANWDHSMKVVQEWPQ